MATTKGTEKSALDLLISLIELDFDAIEAYRAAISRVDDLNDRGRLAEFMQDHERHVSELSEVVRSVGGEPPMHGDLKQILTRGKVVIAGLIGDRVVLAAMKTNEDDTNTAYERAVAHPDLTDTWRELLERNLGDERRHRAWIERRISEAEGTVDLRKAG
jgi:uncharacterized protein (TIGR02284 family)